MLENDVPVLRRRLVGPDARLDFALLEPPGAKLLVVDLGQCGHAQGLHMRVMRPML